MDSGTSPPRRDPPDPVKRALRTEVGFGCPVEGCRKPFLTWHHFDPPWSVEQHHRPEGMVALCTEHHPQADAGAYSMDRLRAFKTGPHPVADVKGNFPWSQAMFLVRLGGIFTLSEGAVLSINNEEVIGLRTNEAGLLEVSFILRDSNDIPFAVMKDNAFECEYDKLYDLVVNTGATHLQIWFAQRKVGLDVDFSRLTADQLDVIIREDRVQAEKRRVESEKDEWKRQLRRLESILNPDERIKSDIESLKTLKNEAPLVANFLRSTSVDASSNETPDHIGDRLRKVALSRCTDSDGLIPFLNFRRLEVHHSGRRFAIRDGLQTEGLSIARGFFAGGLKLNFQQDVMTLG